MTEQEDILSDYEVKNEPWSWHDELTFTAMLIVLSPVILIIAIVQYLKKVISHVLF